MTLDPDKVHIIRSKPKHDSHSDAIREFEGDFECLSNIYRTPVSLRGDPEPYPSVEASKTEDSALKESIRQAKNAIEAKKIARAIKPTAEWRAASEKIVEALVRDKFRRNGKAREILVNTGHVKLIYTNRHDDRIWGVCGGKGDNKLGKLLERVRADMLAGKDIEAWCATRFLLVPKLDVAVGFAVVKGGKVVAEPAFEGQPVIRMGKLEENEVVMAHPSISRSHALVVVDQAHGAFLVDLGASNGTFVDGKRLAPFEPEPISPGGQELTFAKSKRTYQLKMVETDLRAAKKRELYASMAQPAATLTQPDSDSTVYVGNLAPSVTEADLREFFEECGEISSVRIPQDKETGRMRGIAFVAFKKHVGVLHALTLHMDDLKGQEVKVRRADAKSGSKATGAPGASNSKAAGSSEKNGVAGAGTAAVGARADSALEKATAAILRVSTAAASRPATAGAVPVGNGAALASKRQRTVDNGDGRGAPVSEGGVGARNGRSVRHGETRMDDDADEARGVGGSNSQSHASREGHVDADRGSKSGKRHSGSRGSDDDYPGRSDRVRRRHADEIPDRDTGSRKNSREGNGARWERDEGNSQRHGRNGGSRKDRDRDRDRDRDQHEGEDEVRGRGSRRREDGDGRGDRKRERRQQAGGEVHENDEAQRRRQHGNHGRRERDVYEGRGDRRRESGNHSASRDRGESRERRRRESTWGEGEKRRQRREEHSRRRRERSRSGSESRSRSRSRSRGRR